MTRKQSRRRFLKAAAATGVAGSLNAVMLGSAQQGENYIILGGRTVAWQGYRLPGQATASRTSNPTLNLQPGTTYTLLWKNMDGQPHNFAIQDSGGNNLQVLSPLSVQSDQFEELNQTGGNQTTMGGGQTTTAGGNQTGGVELTTTGGETVAQSQIVSEEGAVQAVRFTATQEMAQYICLVHPNTMVGDIQFQSGGGGAGNNSSA